MQPARGPRGVDPALALLSASVLDFFALRGTSDPAPQNLILDEVTQQYLAHMDSLGDLTPRIIEQQLLSLANAVIRVENAKIGKGELKMTPPRLLNYWQLAQILVKLHHVIRIAPNAKDTDREYDLLAMYEPAKGIYTTSEDDIRMTARKYNRLLTLNDFKEVVAVLKEDAPRMHQCSERDLIAVNNGIFHYGTEDLDVEFMGRTFHFKAKTLHPFDPAIVFVAKSRVDYVENAPKQVITHPVDGSVWDVEGWIADLFHTDGGPAFNAKNEGMAALIWETLGAIVRPHVRWGKTAWFYSEQGNNGKGTLCALMRNLVGAGSHTSIPLSDFGKNFALEPLVRANSIIVDENDVGTFIDKAANLKAIVTNDVIQIDRKYRMPIAFQFFGFMVQCLNEFPLVKDKSESFYRRQLFVPFIKSFTGAERKYIKDDYLQRREVLEYVLWYVLNVAGASSPGAYYELSEPIATKVVLSEYKETNDPVRAFWEEFRDKFVWDLLPFSFLYDLFKAWFAEASPSGSVISNQRFKKDLIPVIQDDEVFVCPDKDKAVHTGVKLMAPEPLIERFQLKNWFNATEKLRKTPDPQALIVFTSAAANYRGLQRRTLSMSGVPGLAGDANTTTTPEENQS